MTNVTIYTLIEMISIPAIKEIALSLLSLVPEYWHNVPASSSGNYHPAFSLGEAGLTRHSIVTAYFARRISTAWGWASDMIDMITVAALFHDGMKQGKDAGHTVHEHPVLMAALIRENFPENKWAEMMAHAIEAHMGKWVTSKHSDVVLPAPEDDIQRCLSAADMVAATKELAMEPGFFGETV